MKFKLILYLFIISTLANAQVIHDSIRVDWSGVGYQGDKPEPAIIVNVKDFGAQGDSITNDYQAIIDAVNSLNGYMGIVYFPEGNYLINSPLNLPDSIILRGATSDSTALIFDLGGEPINCINISKGQAMDFTRIITGFEKGSINFTVENPEQFSPGNYAEIRQLNGDWDISPATWAQYSVGQIVKINDISGNSIYIDNALRIDYDTSLNLEIRKIEPKYNVGIECLKIIRADEPEEGAGSNMSFGFAAQCWVKGVESDKSVGSHIYIAQSTQIEITGCYIHHAFTYDGAGTRGYGITLNHHSGECLVQNNILKHLRHALMVKTGANGNVFGYNYSIEPYRSEPIHDFSGDISLHGHYAFSNLFEGNIVQNIIIDHYWGPSGPYNTFFRNRAELYGIIMTTNTILETSRQNFVGNEVTNEQMLYGNYILTGTNHFEFGNNIKGTIIPSGTNDLPDTTYYLDSIPIFWNIIDQLPSVGIPNEIGSGTIPAEERYLSGGILTVCYDSTIYTSFENISYSEENQIKILPNPFTDKINMLIPSEMNDFCQVNMVNLIGQTVFNKKFSLSKGLNKIVVFPPESIKDGVYIMTVKTKNNIYNFKILKQ